MIGFLALILNVLGNNVHGYSIAHRPNVVTVFPELSTPEQFAQFGKGVDIVTVGSEGINDKPVPLANLDNGLPQFLLSFLWFQKVLAIPS